MSDMKSNKFFLLIVVIAVALAGGLFLMNNRGANTSAPGEEKVIRMGVVSTLGDSEKAIVLQENKSFTDYLAQHLSQFGIKRGEVVLTSSVKDMVDSFSQGKTDLYIDTPFPAFIMRNLTGAVPLAIRWRGGEERYRTIIFTKKTSGINTLDDLKGKVIAFQDDTSTSAYFLPKAELLKRGYKLREAKGPDDKVEPDEIGYYFAITDEKIFTDVSEGKAVAGAQNEGEFKKQAGGNILQYRAIFESIYVYRNVVMVRKDLPEGLKRGLRDLLVGLDKTTEGKTVLAQFRKTSKFTRVDSDADKVFREIVELSRYIEQEIINP